MKLLNAISLALLLWSTGAAATVDLDLRAALDKALHQPVSFSDRYDAEVWLVARLPAMQQFVADADEAVQLLLLIHAEATRVDLNPNMVLAVIEVESRFDRFAVSRAGAQGMMQVMSFWKNELGRSDDNLIDTATNLRYGCAILAHYLEREKGNWSTALARYNGSYGQNWYSERVFTALRRWL